MTESEPAGPGGTGPDEQGADLSSQFVTFVVDGETYAFPMESVQEIIRLPRTVRVPLGPPGLIGLANLRGRVVPVVSLRSCCGLEPVEPDEATRVVVVDGGSTLGFVVDRVASVTSVDPGQVEPAARIGAVVDVDLVSAVVRSADGELVKVLEVRRLVGAEFAGPTDAAPDGLPSSGRAPGRAGTLAGGPTGGPPDPDGGTADDTLEFVSFTVDGQEYALPIDLVQEIVQAPEQLTTVPNAQPHVLGVTDLRGGLLPVVGLRRVFGLEAGGLGPEHRIVVVQLPGEDAVPTLVGIVMDTVREVLRVPRAVVTTLPELMARGDRARHVEAVCRLGDDRLVSVLSLEQLFGAAELRAAVGAAASAATSSGAETPEEQTMPGSDLQTDPDDGTDDALLVVFRLDGEEYGVDVDRVQEIIRVPAALIRVPQAPEFVEGLVNLRGSVLPVVDLRTRLGLPRPERDERQRIVVLAVDGVRTGFVVDSVAEVLPVGRDRIEPAPELSADRTRLVTEVANLAGSDRMLLLLQTAELVEVVSPEALAAALPQQRQAATQPVAG